MKKEVLFILLDDYADWEPAFLASSLQAGVMPGCESRYVTKVVALGQGPVRSIGGFRTLPDYTLDTVPADYAALVLVGGMAWQSDETERVVPLVRRALAEGRIVGAICNAASFLCRHGFLNTVKHTGNTLQQLQEWGGEAYTNSAGYVERQAVSDGGIVTANGTGYLEFARELLLLLEADTPERIEASYRFNKEGFVK